MNRTMVFASIFCDVAYDQKLSHAAGMPIAARIIGGTGMLASGCAFGAVAVQMLRKSCKRVSKGVTTQGTVIGSEFQRRIGAGKSYYLPKVEFETLNGEKITFVTTIGSNADPKIGRKVKVSYFPENPQDADIVSSFRSWFFPLFFLAGALLFLLFAIEFYTAFFGAATPRVPKNSAKLSDVTILSAKFGRDSHVADVTPRVIELISGHPNDGFKADAMRLGVDPLPGKNKVLTIRYSYQGSAYLLTIPGATRVDYQLLINNTKK